jgi:kynureninase
MKVTDREYALELDQNDPLAGYRSKFVITDPNLCYLDGNSLGRLPHATVKAVSDLVQVPDKFWSAIQHRLISISSV